MPRNSSGTYSTPAGQPVVSGTTISSVAHNNLVSDLAAELTDSASRSGKGGFTAPVRAADGTVNAPAHAFTSETGTGLFRKGAHNPAIAVNETERQEWTDAGTSITGTLAVSGNTTVGGTLGVTGNATMDGTLAVAGSVALNDGVLVTGTATLGGNATVGGTLGVTGNTTLGGTLAVTGKATSAATAAGDGSTTLATKGYVDALADGTASIVAGTDWIVSGTTLCKSNDGVVTLVFIGNAGASASSFPVATLPVGYRPPYDVRTAGYYTGATSNVVPFSVNGSGQIGISSLFVASRIYGFSVSFKAT